MPRKIRLDSLKSDLVAANNQLTIASQYGDIVGVSQFQKRIAQLNAEIEAISSSHLNHASVALYFSGEPVLGSRGIAAEFAGKCLENYQDLVSKLFARQERGELGERGRVPLRNQTSMMVTGVTHGSFGFILDEMSEQTEIYDTQLKHTIKEVSELIESFSSTDELAFAESASQIDQRTLSSLHSFFKEMDTSNATLRIVEDLAELRLDEYAVSRGRLRAERSSISEDEMELNGVFIGMLPEHKTFELRNADGDLVYGKATPAAVEQYLQSMATGVQLIGQQCVARLHKRTIRPLNREPRVIYRLLSFNSLG